MTVCIVSCKSEVKKQGHGLDDLNTLVSLQKSHSNKKIGEYLDQFEGWRLFYKDPVKGYSWGYNSRGPSSTHMNFELRLDVLNANQEFKLLVTFSNENLRTRYLYQISTDTSFRLIDKMNIYDEETRYYSGKGRTIIFDRHKDGMYFLSIEPGK